MHRDTYTDTRAAQSDVVQRCEVVAVEMGGSAQFTNIFSHSSYCAKLLPRPRKSHPANEHVHLIYSSSPPKSAELFEKHAVPFKEKAELLIKRAPEGREAISSALSDLARKGYGNVGCQSVSNRDLNAWAVRSICIYMRHNMLESSSQTPCAPGDYPGPGLR